jgi:hypothetical protein
VLNRSRWRRWVSIRILPARFQKLLRSPLDLSSIMSKDLINVPHMKDLPTLVKNRGIFFAECLASINHPIARSPFDGGDCLSWESRTSVRGENVGGNSVIT